ncbi:hypothetical protein CERSUDRAFT_138406 [Gelatoporia subvermispora B]|uniref:AAA+ ATPase domain-containing protein n=1 Tax=Ceriporiopsis subvermispora (strain B) TaxID=914234 RepID=M2QUF9_CERS8|nr:hypothetical protein CERSUDRAFT_138406 [Gelatoporia subvermispora B]
MWVFEGGEWSKSKSLFRAVQSASWDDIVLDESFREGLRRDTETFFASKETYKSLGVGWKRGLLLLGPPGNGKTESIKALLREFSHYSALYVKSINSHMGPEYGVHSVFEHARKHSPCILVLEDLDSMIIDRIRSFFLNELDGLAENEGILTIATTNHPENIDDAILNRPSRFDVKYNFALPSFQLRAKFAAMWLRKFHTLNTGMIFQRPDAELAKSIAEQTEEWSFAFLKELFVSFLLRVAHDKSLEMNSGGPLDEVLLDQVDKLAPQVLIAKNDPFDDARSTGSPMVHSVRLPSGMMHARPLSL